MPKRYKEALFIQAGASNPSGICHTIIQACKECFDEKKTPTKDAAIRLMVHQLAHICNIHELDKSLTAYSKLTEECHERSIADETR